MLNRTIRVSQSLGESWALDLISKTGQHHLWISMKSGIQRVSLGPIIQSRECLIKIVKCCFSVR